MSIYDKSILVLYIMREKTSRGKNVGKNQKGLFIVYLEKHSGYVYIKLYVNVFI